MRLRRGISALTVGAALLAPLLTAPPGAGRAADTPRNCGWQFRFDPTAVNTLYPDQVANYWFLAAPAVPGATITLNGTYPHARYISLITYDPALRAVDGLNDQGIGPDPGSSNPFLAGANRTVTMRAYTVTVVFGQVPATRQPNTIYTTDADGAHVAPFFLVVYRIYRVDQAYDLQGDITGGVPLPKVTYNAPGAAPATLPDCPYPPVPPTTINQQIANAGSPASSPLFQYPGTNPPTYHKFYNLPTSLTQAPTDNGYTGTTIGDAASVYTMQLPSGGFLQNLDNAYVFAQLTHGYGNVAVVHGQLPTFPETYPNATTMGTGQLRYWSLCTNDGPSERYYGCLNDDKLHLDANGYYTIVISTDAARPVCTQPPPTGPLPCADWLPWGPNGAVLVILRNMLPDPSFANSIQAYNFTSPPNGPTLPQSMAVYYPCTGYYSPAPPMPPPLPLPDLSF